MLSLVNTITMTVTLLNCIYAIVIIDTILLCAPSTNRCLARPPRVRSLLANQPQSAPEKSQPTMPIQVSMQMIMKLDKFPPAILQNLQKPRRGRAAEKAYLLQQECWEQTKTLRTGRTRALQGVDPVTSPTTLSAAAPCACVSHDTGPQNLIEQTSVRNQVFMLCRDSSANVVAC